MNVIALVLYLLMLLVSCMLHDYLYGFAYETRCYPRESKAADVKFLSVDLLRLIVLMLETETKSSADCRANRKIVIWDQKHVMLNPRFPAELDRRYECRLWNSKLVMHGRYLDVTYYDLEFNEKQMQITGRKTVCEFLNENSKFIV